MLCKDLAEIVGGLIGLNPEIPDFHLTVHACYLQLRIEAEEGIAPQVSFAWADSSI